MSSGLAAVFIEAPEKMQEANTSVPQVMLDHCKYWNMPTSGNVVGKMSITDFAGQPWGPFPLKMVSPLRSPPSFALSSPLLPSASLSFPPSRSLIFSALLTCLPPPLSRLAGTLEELMLTMNRDGRPKQ